MTRFLALVVFILVLQGVGYLLGTSFPAGEWYEGLNQPPFRPPNWLFGAVWPVLYLLIAIAGWRVFTSDGRIPGWGLWLGQMVLNWAWTPVFFGLHWVGTALVLLALTLLLSVAFMVRTWPHDRIAAGCFVPYVAWLAFAFALNLWIWWMN